MSVNKEFMVEAMSHSCGIPDKTYPAGYLERVMTE